MHEFFKILDLADKQHKKKGATWGVRNLKEKENNFDRIHKRQFFVGLPQAHPFVFDKKTTIEKVMGGRGLDDMENLVEEFSLPFSNSLYLLTNPPSIVTPFSNVAAGEEDLRAVITTWGYLISEKTPEQFLISAISWMEFEGIKLPSIEVIQLDLNELRTGEWKSVADESVKMHFLKECACILNLTKCISVKRIGVEKAKNFSVRSTGVNRNYTTVKVDNLVHIADKVDYEYVEPFGDGDINWEWVGFWRGHWRAFYKKDDDGNKLKDFRGWNVVDYERIGKNREGSYEVAGYTWVKEHTKGDPALAEIKTRVVKKP